MPKLKYYNDIQRQEGKQIAMLEYQEKQRRDLITKLGGRCRACATPDIDTLLIAEGSLWCGSCRQRNRAVEARKRLASRKAALEQYRIESWTKSTNEHRKTDQTPSTNQE